MIILEMCGLLWTKESSVLITAKLFVIAVLLRWLILLGIYKNIMVPG